MDTRAKKILMNTYWKNGWIDSKTSNEDFAYAKSKGLMFDPLDSISHDECISQILVLANKIKKEEVGRAFLSSLTAHRLDWRSGLASFHIAKQLSNHTYTPVVSGHSYEDGVITYTSYTCGVCKDAQYGIVGNHNYSNVDLNVLNFERIKWGGVRHGCLIYTLFDLTLFFQENIQEPNIQDICIFRDILKVIEDSEENDCPSTLENNLKDVFKANKSERKMLIEILSCIGVLSPKSYDRPLRGKSDWVYSSYWRGEDGYNEKALRYYFDNYID